MKIYIILSFYLFNLIACNSNKNHTKIEKGRVDIKAIKNSNNFPRGFLNIKILDAQNENQKITFSEIFVNGISMPTLDSVKQVLIKPGKFKVAVRSPNFYPISKTIKIEQGYDIYMIFYLQDEPRY